MTESTFHRGLKRKRPSTDVCSQYHSIGTSTQGQCTGYPRDQVTGQIGTPSISHQCKKSSLNVLGSNKKHHTIREVKKAAKKAKTFETQKLVKKLKGAKESDKDEAEIVDLERQLNA